MIEVINGGMYTSVQDYPGRIGYWGVGVPPSGPMDSLAFRIANKLVKNDASAAGLEMTMTGPALRFTDGAVIAVTGAKLQADLDGQEVPWWKPFEIQKGSVLTFGAIDTSSGGLRTYLAVRGGIDVPIYLGSRSTFPFGNFGGCEGRILRAGDILPVGTLAVSPENQLVSSFSFSALPLYTDKWEIGVIPGPHSSPDYFTAEDEEMIYSTDWKVHHNSNRLGYRLEGPSPKFSRSSGGEGGNHPSNILDYTYAVGTINFTGNMPIVLTVDGPSLGGFVSFATIATAELWKIGQANLGDKIRFKKISIEQALDIQRWQNAMIAGIS